jgi:WD40 repeat protein
MHIFDLTTGKPLYQLSKGGLEIRDVAFAGNDRLVTVDRQRTIHVWEARTDKWIRLFDHDTQPGESQPRMMADGWRRWNITRTISIGTGRRT